MGRTRSRGRRALLFTLGALTLGAPCCGGGDSGRPSQVEALRVLAVTADTPYAAPDATTVTFRMTYADALGKAGAGEGEARPIQITWIGGCFNPFLDSFEACIPQIQGVLQGIASGTESPLGLVKQEVMGPEQSGVPDAASFELKLPEDVFARAQLAENGTPYTTAYVFFAACAGTVQPAEPTPEEGLGFPLKCVDEQGATLNAESFVAGYTQVYVFADGRTNQNPPVKGLAVEGLEVLDGEENAPTVARCVEAAEAAQSAGCGAPQESTGCATLEVEAMVEDVAEVDVESSGPGMSTVREAVWVDYFADGGEFDGAKKLVSDATTGYRAEHGTTWTPPAEAGLVSLWAVVHDARGGMSVTRRFVRVK